MVSTIWVIKSLKPNPGSVDIKILQGPRPVVPTLGEVLDPSVSIDHRHTTTLQSSHEVPSFGCGMWILMVVLWWWHCHLYHRNNSRMTHDLAHVSQNVRSKSPIRMFLGHCLSEENLFFFDSSFWTGFSEPFIHYLGVKFGNKTGFQYNNWISNNTW